MAITAYAPVSWERMSNGVEKVRQRLVRVAQALDRASVRYAVVGGHAVAAWVSRVDETVVRNTRDVDILLRRADLDGAKTALAEFGFVFRHVKGIDMFLDGAEGKAGDAVHIVFAGEKVKPDYLEEAPDLVESDPAEQFQLISLDALVRMKLTSFRDRDRVHLRDLIGVDLLDASCLERLPPALRPPVQVVLDSP